jgi:acyl-CoA reductase-like NAD-dependent aldehyde dehydrogenase
MHSPLPHVATAPARSTGEGPLPCYVGRERYTSRAFHDVLAEGRVVARLSQAPRLLQFKMVKKAEGAFAALRRIAPGELGEIFRKAAAIFGGDRDAPAQLPEGFDDHVARIVSTTGLTQRAVEYSLGELKGLLLGIRRAVCAQSPDGDDQVYRTWTTSSGYGFTPNGRTVAIRIPDNSPSSINVTWLLALAMRRPVLLVAEPRLAHTVCRLADALDLAGLPDGAISICYGEAEGFWSLAAQIVWPGKVPEHIGALRKPIHRYHLGRSKAILLEGGAIDGMWERLAGMAKHNCGRVCTKLTAVLTDGSPSDVAEKLARAMTKYRIRDLHDPEAVVPAFPDPTIARAASAMIAVAINRGAVDHSARLADEPLVAERSGRTFVRPTVLQVAPDDPLFGAELPFPFLTVAGAGRAALPALCKNSLIVNVVGDDAGLVDELLIEPTISKILINEDVGRKYDPAEPHQGFLSDFLFSKKTVSSRAHLSGKAGP